MNILRIFTGSNRQENTRMFSLSSKIIRSYKKKSIFANFSKIFYRWNLCRNRKRTVTVAVKAGR